LLNFKIVGCGSVIDGVFKKREGYDGWTDLYYDSEIVTKSKTYRLKVNRVKDDRSGLVFGVFNQKTADPDLSYINQNVYGLSACNTEYTYMCSKCN